MHRATQAPRHGGQRRSQSLPMQQLPNCSSEAGPGIKVMSDPQGSGDAHKAMSRRPRAPPRSYNAEAQKGDTDDLGQTRPPGVGSPRPCGSCLGQGPIASCRERERGSCAAGASLAARGGCYPLPISLLTPLRAQGWGLQANSSTPKAPAHLSPSVGLTAVWCPPLPRLS